MTEHSNEVPNASGSMLAVRRLQHTASFCVSARKIADNPFHLLYTKADGANKSHLRNQIRNSRLIRVVSTYCFLFIVKNQPKVLVNQGLFLFGGAFRYLRCLYLVSRMPQNAEKHYSLSMCSAFLSLKDQYSLDYKSYGYITNFPLYDPIPPMS